MMRICRRAFVRIADQPVDRMMMGRYLVVRIRSAAVAQLRMEQEEEEHRMRSTAMRDQAALQTGSEQAKVRGHFQMGYTRPTSVLAPVDCSLLTLMLVLVEAGAGQRAEELTHLIGNYQTNRMMGCGCDPLERTAWAAATRVEAMPRAPLPIVCLRPDQF